MPQPYTLDEINAEIARREAARNAASGNVATAAQPAARTQAPAPELASSHGSGAMPAENSPALPNSPRRSMWDSAADTVAGMGRSLGTGVSEALPKYALGVNKLLGLHGFESTRKLFIDPLEQRLQAIQAREAQDLAGAGTGEEMARAAARGVGNLATLPLDIAMGAATKTAALGTQAIEAVPRVATSVRETFRAIPEFALGMGIRKTGEEESIAGLPKGIAEGMVMHRVGEVGKDMSFLPRAATQVGAQGGLGAAMTTTDTLEHEGRLPTGRELAVGAGSNAAMALPFVGAPGKMGVKRELTPEMRKDFESRITELVKTDQITALPDEALAQLRDTAGKIAEYDPENQTILRGLLLVDQEQQRRAGVETQPMAVTPPAETAPVKQRPYSRAELAGMATGDLESQDRLMEIAGVYGIKEPHKMEPGALIEAIDKAEGDRQAEAQRQQDAARAVADMQSQAEQARNDILMATDEAGRLDAIKRFEDATKALSQAPALPAGQGFDLVPHEQRQDVQAGRAMQEEQLAALQGTPALPEGQGFELVGGPKPMTQAEAAAIEAAGRPALNENAPVEPMPAADSAAWDRSQFTSESDLIRDYQAQALADADARGNEMLDFVRGRLDAQSVANHFGSSVLEDLRGRLGPGAFRKKGNGGVSWDVLEAEAKSQGLLSQDANLVDALQNVLPAKRRTMEDAARGIINGQMEADGFAAPRGSAGMEPPTLPSDRMGVPEDEGLTPLNSDGSPRDGVFYDRAPKAQAPAEFARTYGIPETPEFLDAIKLYQEITGKKAEAGSDFASVSPEEAGAGAQAAAWDAFPAREDGSRVVARVNRTTADEINRLGNFSTTESDAVLSRGNLEYIARKHGDQLSPEDVAYLKKTIEEPTEILPNLTTPDAPHRSKDILLVRKNGKNYVAIVEMTPGEGENHIWNYWKMSPGKAENYLKKFRDEKAARMAEPGWTTPTTIESGGALPTVSPEGLSGAQAQSTSTVNISPASTGIKGAGKAAVENWLSPVRDRLAEHVKVEVVDRPDEVSPAIRQQMAEENPDWAAATGYTLGGQSYVFAWNIADRAEARQTVKHEVQHQITTAFFEREAAQEPHKGPAEKRMSDFLKQVIKTKRSEISDHMLRSHGKDFDPQSPMHWLIGASEWLAEARISEPTMYERYTAALVSMLREVGDRLDIHWLRDMKMTDAELKAFNERLWKGALRQGRASDLLEPPTGKPGGGGTGGVLASVAPAETGSPPGDMVPPGDYSRREPLEPFGQPAGTTGPLKATELQPVRVELPEMVRLTRELMGKSPAVKERLSKAAASGLFRPNPDNPALELRADIFIGPKLAEVQTKDPEAAKPQFMGEILDRTGLEPKDVEIKTERAKGGWTIMRAYKVDADHAGNVLAHEIGHLVDFLPDKTMARGNILGRLASLKGYMKTMIESLPDSGAELISQAERDVLRKQIRDGYLNDISMNRADFEGDAELSGTIKAEIDKRFEAAITDEMRRRGLIGRNEVTTELKALTQWWKPFNEAGDPAYTAYRHSSPELYADAFSVLLNSPGELHTRAPRFYDAFQNWLIQKPEVREAYQGIQNAIHSGEIYRTRVEALRDGFRQADDARGLLYEGEKSLKENLKESKRWATRAFVDQYAPVREVLTGEDASYAINRAIYSGSEKELYVSEMQSRVSQPLAKAGLTPDDLGEYLFHKRVINERDKMANPHGFNPKASRERLEEMRTSTFTPAQVAVLEGAEKSFREIRADLLTDKMAQSGMFAPELMQHIREATDYATFDVVKHIDDAFGPGIGSMIHKQVGTTEAVGNPYTATLKKDLSMLSSINWNNAKKAVVDDLLANRPDQITPAETRFNGKSMAPVDKTTDKVGTLYLMHEGKVQGYYVDRLVAEAFNRERPEDLQVLGKILSAMATPSRVIFTTIRPGFQAFNAIRDLRTLYRNLPGSGNEGGIITTYLKSLPEAWAAEFGITPEIVKEMQRDNMLISVVDPLGVSKIDQEHDRLMRMYHLEPGKYQDTIWKPFMQLYGQALKLGGFLERIPKIAAYRYLKENFPEWSQDQIGEFVRTKAGSPAFLYKGSLSSVTNNLFLFSNAIVQGIRGDFGAMKENPNGWWAKWAKGTIAPKMISRLALYGAFGAGVKAVMDGIGDYDLSNYDVIPLGLDANGKSVYLRLPVDEMGRMTSSLLWKGMNLVDGQAPTKPADIFDFMAGQAPNVAPWMTVLGGVTSYISGHNPYDAFYGREVIDPTVFKAGGTPSHEQMLKWIWNTSGGGIIHRFDNHEVDLVKTELQKAIGLPGVNDFLGRFLRVSDYGLREKLRAAGGIEESKRARDVLETRSAMAKLLNGETLSDAENVALARDSKYVKQNYGRLMTKQQNEALLSALQGAGSQLEKAAVLQEWERLKGKK